MWQCKCCTFTTWPGYHCWLLTDHSLNTAVWAWWCIQVQRMPLQGSSALQVGWKGISIDSRMLFMFHLFCDYKHLDCLNHYLICDYRSHCLEISLLPIFKKGVCLISGWTVALHLVWWTHCYSNRSLEGIPLKDDYIRSREQDDISYTWILFAGQWPYHFSLSYHV